MNQITSLDTQPAELYIFDCDGLLYRHRPEKCYGHMRDVGAKVISAYTDMPLHKARRVGHVSWHRHRDGFRTLESRVGTEKYQAMHRHFDMVSRLDVSGETYDELPGLIKELSNHAQVCFASHTTTNSLKMSMTRMKFNSVMIAHHAYGLDRLGEHGNARKDDPQSGVFQWLCKRYDVHPARAAVVEDSTDNLDCANNAGIGRCAHVGWNIKEASIPDLDMYQTTMEFVQGELEKFRGVDAIPNRNFSRMSAAACSPV